MIEEERLHTDSLRKFAKKLLLASAAKQHRKRKTEELSKGFEKIKKIAGKKEPVKKEEQKELNKEINKLHETVSDMLQQDRKFIEKQKTEDKLLDELSQKIELLDQKISGQQHLHSFTSSAHLQKINKIKDKMDLLHEKVTSPELRKQEIKKTKKVSIFQIEKQVKKAEKIHTALAKKGYSKSQLYMLKRQIEKHKKAIERHKKNS